VLLKRARGFSEDQDQFLATHGGLGELSARIQAFLRLAVERQLLCHDAQLRAVKVVLWP
jgi:hypothetical protein